MTNGCPQRDWSVWNAYAPKVPDSAVEIMRALFERFCEEVQRRGLPWNAARHGETIGFKVSPGGKAFKIAMHCAKAQRGEFKPPSFLIHPGRPLDDLGEANPYPGLGMFWQADYSAQGWSVFSIRQVPDPAPAIDLAIKYGEP